MLPVPRQHTAYRQPAVTAVSGSASRVRHRRDRIRLALPAGESARHRGAPVARDARTGVRPACPLRQRWGGGDLGRMALRCGARPRRCGHPPRLGVGSGVVVGGKPFETSNPGNGVSGWATNIQTAATVPCGNRGCAETPVSATPSPRGCAIPTRKVPSIPADRFRDDPHSIGFALVEGVRAGDRIRREILAESVRTSGHGRHGDPQRQPTIVVLAGGPMSAADLFLADVQAHVDEYAFIFPRAHRHARTTSPGPRGRARQQPL